MNDFQIPLSYSSMASEGLIQVLQRFEGRPHEEAITEFENRLAALTSSPFVVALNSGTAAIHLALKVLGVTAEDNVPISTFTYVGSVNPILYQGANPVFIDSEEATWNLNPDLLEKCLKDLSHKGKLPKAMIVVHAYGMPAQMEQITLISKEFGVPIIEDAAEALGGLYKGLPLGSIGDIGVLSFNNNKSMTTFGGGALLTRSHDVYEKVKFLATQAREALPFYEHKEVGFNYRMSPLNAACGIAQIEKIISIVEQRRNVFERYERLLKSEEIKFQEEPKDFFSNRWLTTILFKTGIDPLDVQKKLEENNIESRPLWKPMHMQPVFKDAHCYGGSVSEGLFKAGLCLPSGSALTEKDLHRVTGIILPELIKNRS